MRLVPQQIIDVCVFNLNKRAYNVSLVAPPLSRPLHPMRHVHTCTAYAPSVLGSELSVHLWFAASVPQSE